MQYTARMSKPSTHDSSDAVNILEMTLVDGSRPLALLIGAGGGCSIMTKIGPLIPAIAGLTVDVQSAIKAKTTLKILDDSLKEDGNSKPTVEDWLTRARTLITVVGKDTVRGLTKAELETLESEIVVAIAKRVAVTLPAGDSGYESVARWASEFDRSHPLELFTLSYDMLMEQALESNHVSYFDGFVGSYEPFLDLRAMEEDNLPNRWARFWKMHGSISWKSRDGMTYRTAEWKNGKFDRTLIHPSHLKYDQSRRMPYLSMQDRLRTFMRRPGAALITIGYSFGDQHINELIEEGLRVNPGAVAFGLLFDDLADFDDAVELATRESGLRLYAKDAAVIGRVSLPWAMLPSGELVPRFGDFNTFGGVLDRITVKS